MLRLINTTTLLSLVKKKSMEDMLISEKEIIKRDW